MNRAQTRFYWRCLERNVCNATGSTNFNVQNGIFFLCGKPHLHEPDDVEMKVQEIPRAIKWTATKQNHPNAPPSSIFRDEISTLNDTEVSMKL